MGKITINGNGGGGGNYFEVIVDVNSIPLSNIEDVIYRVATTEDNVTTYTYYLGDSTNQTTTQIPIGSFLSTAGGQVTDAVTTTKDQTASGAVVANNEFVTKAYVAAQGGGGGGTCRVKVVEGPIDDTQIEDDYDVYIAYDSSETPEITTDDSYIIPVNNGNHYGVFVKMAKPLDPDLAVIAWGSCNPAAASAGEGLVTSNAEVQFIVTEGSGGRQFDPSLFYWSLQGSVPNVSIDQTGKVTVEDISGHEYEYVDIYAEFIDSGTTLEPYGLFFGTSFPPVP